MRRADREVTDFTEITDILRRADTIRLGLRAEPYPYVVPLSFGFEVIGGKILMYFHGAKEGFKHDLILADPHVCVETDIFYRYAETTTGVTTEYESFIGFGRTKRIDGAEVARAMDLMLAHCGFEGYAYDPAALDATAIYKIEIDSFSGKRRTVG